MALLLFLPQDLLIYPEKIFCRVDSNKQSQLQT